MVLFGYWLLMNLEFTNIVHVSMLVKIVLICIFRLLMEWSLFVTLANFENCEQKRFVPFLVVTIPHYKFPRTLVGMELECALDLFLTHMSCDTILYV
jgi:hypothetical protein